MKTKEIIIKFVKKYPVETISILLLSIFLAISVDLRTIEVKDWFGIFVIPCFVALGSYLTDKILAIYEKEINQKLKKIPIGNENTSNLFFIIIATLIQYLLYRWLCVLILSSTSNFRNFFSDSESVVIMMFSFGVVSFLMLFLISYFVIKEKEVSLKKYLLKMFMSLLALFIIELVVLIGIIILYAICEALLGGVNTYVMSRIVVFTLCIVFSMGLFVSIENVDGKNSLFSKILVRYIMQIMVFIGFIIFYIYLFKIIFAFTLPSNQVFAVCTTLFTIGLLTNLMSQAIEEKSVYSIAIKYLPVAFIPAFILQVIAVTLRIHQHGLTTLRYLGVLFIIFEGIYLVYYIFSEVLNNKKFKLEKMFLVSSLMFVLIFFIPKINIFEFHKIYNKVFYKQTETFNPIDESKENVASKNSSNQSVVVYDEANLFKRDGYKLKEVVILSRHNIRSPLANKNATIARLTPHSWFNWSSKPSDLSLRGGTLETTFGQYFRKCLEEVKFFDENIEPSLDEVRIYSNSKQRTIATANYFLTGLFPISNMDVEHHMPFDEMDPVFNPVLTDIDEEFASNAGKQIQEMFKSTVDNLEDNYRLIENVIDVKDSVDYKEKKFEKFRTDDLNVIFAENSEPALTGSLKTALQISDALVLQYYECDEKNEAFGKKLTRKEWEDIAEVKDVYEEVLFSAPLVAYNVANPLLKEILTELQNDRRKLTFLCGHDSNLVSVLSALQAEDYKLDYAIEKKTPIGSKVVFSKWEDEDGKMYISIDYVYQTVEQLKYISLLNTDNPPAIFPIKLKGITRNKEGLYTLDDILERFKFAISMKNVM